MACRFSRRISSNHNAFFIYLWCIFRVRFFIININFIRLILISFLLKKLIKIKVIFSKYFLIFVLIYERIRRDYFDSLNFLFQTNHTKTLEKVGYWFFDLYPARQSYHHYKYYFLVLDQYEVPIFNYEGKIKILTPNCMK